MSIFDMFSRPAAPQQQQQTTQQRQNPATPDTNQVQSDGSVVGIPKTGEGDKSPLANYDKLWENPTTQALRSAVPDINSDYGKMLETSKTIDFSKHVNPDDVAKALKGDATAFSAVISQVGQAAVAMSVASSSAVTSNALKTQETNLLNSVVPELFRRREAAIGLRENNPIFSNPAVAPMVAGLERQLAEKYPTETSQQITARATEFFSNLSEAIVATNGGSVVKKGDKPAGGGNSGLGSTKSEADWQEYFGNPVISNLT